MVATAEAERTSANKASGATKKQRTRKATSKPTAKRQGKKAMTDEHKASLAQGRDWARTVGRYLEALDEHKPKRGRKITVEGQRRKLEQAERDILTASPIERLNLLQVISDLKEDIALRENADPATDITALKEAAVKVLKPYCEKKGISKKTLVKAGVPADVLKEAGFGRANAKAAA